MYSRILTLPSHVSGERLEALVAELRAVGLEVHVTEETLVVRGDDLEDTLELDDRLQAVETTGPSPGRQFGPR